MVPENNKIPCPNCASLLDGAEVFCPKCGTRLGNTTEMKTVTTGSGSVKKEDALIGSVIQGRYKVIKRIGEGGMGVVYVAEHVEIEKKVALKVLRDDFSSRPEVVERFKLEARSASKIGNAHIVDVTDFGQLNDGGVFFAMEYLQGQGLSDLIEKGEMDLNRSVRIVRQIARALLAAHKMGIVHRDLKPENIFLVEQDENPDFVKILDFGIAKISDRDSEGKRLTKTGMIFGTPEYMSPEQAAGKELDHRVDIYALGCIMFEIFTGKVPYDGDSFMAVLTQHMFEPVPDMENIKLRFKVPKSVKSVVYKAMAKKPDDRYSQMNDLSSDLARAAKDSGYIVETTQSVQTVHKQSRRSRPAKSADNIQKQSKKKSLLFAYVALVVIVLAGAVGLFVLYGKDKNITTIPTASILPVPQEDKNPVLNKEFAKKETRDIENNSKTRPDGQVGDKPKVKVKFFTTPPGALISIGKMGQVCSATPCTVTLEEGKPVEITGTYKNIEKKVTFTPLEQNKLLSLQFPLKKKKRVDFIKSKNTSSGSNKPAKEKTSGNAPDSPGILKTPEIFKLN